MNAELRVHKVQVLDTGIGRSLGYFSDVHFLACAENERRDMPLLHRRVAEEIDRKMDEALLYGDGMD